MRECPSRLKKCVNALVIVMSSNLCNTGNKTVLAIICICNIGLHNTRNVYSTFYLFFIAVYLLSHHPKF